MDGVNGKTPEIRINGNQLQWKYNGETEWKNLYDLSTLKGAVGQNGVDEKMECVPDTSMHKEV